MNLLLSSTVTSKSEAILYLLRAAPTTVSYEPSRFETRGFDNGSACGRLRHQKGQLRKEENVLDIFDLQVVFYPSLTPTRVRDLCSTNEIFPRVSVQPGSCINLESM